ncbi:Zeta toxin [Parashewanella curva]|uniref:Zeta toxin n=1 Tax=Parashewanella curva TaxID=2338552 RepID=A0A3L8PTC6_9GAMM|nr:zeta toxin family protein [Parashewanella curva]RLV57863.1 Zeta toxin [Parashewanella curva]
MNQAEQEIELRAIEFAKKNRTRIGRELSDSKKFPADEQPVSIFMCGSPGAGKTEASKVFLEAFADTSIIRLDPDELRDYFEDYTGNNSYLFQKGVSFIVERTLDFIFKNNQSFVLDGTFSNFNIACKNIDRSLNRERSVLIIFVYQEPLLAWKFVQAREKVEGRRIKPETFIEQFFGSQTVIRQVKAKYGDAVKVDLLLKNTDGSPRAYRDNIENIDEHIDKKYSRSDLERLLDL